MYTDKGVSIYVQNKGSRSIHKHYVLNYLAACQLKLVCISCIYAVAISHVGHYKNSDALKVLMISKETHKKSKIIL